VLYGFPRYYKAIVKSSVVIDPKQSTRAACCVLRLVKSVLFKKSVDSKIVVRSVFFFNIVRNNGRKIKSFFKNAGGI
jgi:hypothetical protein